MGDFIDRFDERMKKDNNLKKLYLEEQLVLRITNIISELMQEQGVKKSELAQRVGCSKGYITQLLDGTKNMTLKTVSNVLFELGHTLAVKPEHIIEHLEGGIEARRVSFLYKTRIPVWREERIVQCRSNTDRGQEGVAA